MVISVRQAQINYVGSFTQPDAVAAELMDRLILADWLTMLTAPISR